MNLLISLVLVIKFGLIGVAIGTLTATVFRSFQYAFYLSKNIMNRKIGIFVGHIAVNIISTGIICLIYKYFLMESVNSWWDWVIQSFEVAVIASVVALLMDLLFYKKDLLYLISKMKRGKKHG